MEIIERERNKNIGLEFIFENLEILTPFGLDEKKKLAPYKIDNKDCLIIELDNIERITIAASKKQDVFKKLKNVLCKAKEIRGTVERCKRGEALDIVEIYEIKRFCFLMKELIPLFVKLDTHIEGVEFQSPYEIISILDPDGTGLPTFQIYDSYSEKLKDIREKKRNLEGMISNSTDSSLTRKLMEERLEIVCIEENEELMVRRTLTAELSGHLSNITKNVQSIGKLDILMAKAGLSIKFGGTKPKICEDMEISFTNMVNPEIAAILSKNGKKYTPVSIDLVGGVTQITGANMGGKSVTLKSTVLNLILGHMGFFVFCESARFPLFDYISFIGGDLQSVTRGLSSFGAEIIELKTVLDNAVNKKGFIAIDEFARDTNPEEGYCFIKALCKYLTGLNCISLVSTHYENVVSEGMNHYQVIGLKNADFKIIKQRLKDKRCNSIEIIQEYMDYKLEKVSENECVPKDALNIAKILGMQDEVIEIMEKFYNRG